MTLERALALSLSVALNVGPFWPAAHAEEATKTRRVGVIDPTASAIFADGFRDGLRRVGYIEGKTVILEWRGTAETEEELQSMVDDLARSKDEVLVTIGTPATRAALQRTTLPVVFSVGDPVASGFASSLAKPGGNGTGVSSVATDLEMKRVQVIHQLVPKARRIGSLFNPANPISRRLVPDVQAAARTLGVELKTLAATNPQELEEVLHLLGQNPPDALMVASVSFYIAHASAITQAVRKARIPTLYPFREYLIAGGLAVYGVDLKQMGDSMAGYVDKILSGAKPGDLPIEQMSKYDLVINLRAAREMGVQVPQDLLYRADEVIR